MNGLTTGDNTLNLALSASFLGVRAAGVRGFDAAYRCADGAWAFAWEFSADDCAFTGHYPHQRILPGVFLLEMAEHAIRFLLEQSGKTSYRLSRVESFRFVKPILPGDICTIEVRLAPAGNAQNTLQATVECAKADGVVAKGVLFAREPAARSEGRHDA